MLHRVAAVDGKQGEPLPFCEGRSIPSYVAKRRESVRFGDINQVSCDMMQRGTVVLVVKRCIRIM